MSNPFARLHEWKPKPFNKDSVIDIKGFILAVSGCMERFEGVCPCHPRRERKDRYQMVYAVYRKQYLTYREVEYVQKARKARSTGIKEGR